MPTHPFLNHSKYEIQIIFSFVCMEYDFIKIDFAKNMLF